LRHRGFGDVWLCWTLWRVLDLELDLLCAGLMPEGREEVRWSAVAAVLVIARVCEPSSELHVAEDWYRGTALEDVLDIAFATGASFGAWPLASSEAGGST
jgi:hypothetical protein